MDIFKGIGDFFGGLFGQKKKREDEQQPQQQQSAVSFNSTPKLGDNFANNLSNPTQPQQPKEFAKSSVDLNPVKPVQPVQSQPQMNREQERQQLANKYRQEETDRYNQGSDHAANFLNDIFSGGRTAQMRENTINQNIQNRVNAEMLRKYGPDDQQVKQNIAQTSQNINKNASAVGDFTKNYNNNIQQTISAPVSAVKGAANSVVETVPKVSGAITELGANTIKLFDEDNQFANNLIKRVRADREKNIVRKTLNDATGLTDQDNKMAYGLGSSGARMAIDAAMTPVTGGLAPAVVHGVEAHSEMMDHLDNIEARKKAEAVAKGETYTPSSFTSRYLASTANAGAQAAIEKLGIDNLTGKIGGKFAKNMVGRAITGALGEAGEEGAQQYAENFTKKLFDNKQNIHEGVAESALMGGIMGGAGKMAFGGMESVKNPYKSNNMADGEVSISKLHLDAVLGNTKRNTYYDPKALYEAERNAVTPTREKITLAEAERRNRGGDLQYTPRRETNIGRLDSDQLGFTKDELIGRFTGDTRKRMSERSFNMLQDLRANNPYVTGDGQEVYLSARSNKKLSSTSATIDDATFKARMRTTPRFEEILRSSNKTHSAEDLKQHGIAPDGFDYLSSPVNVNGKRYMQEFDIGKNNETGRNTVYNSKLKEEPELSGFYTRSNSGSYGSNISQNDQKVNAFNRKYEPEIQDLQNAYQKYGDDFEFNLTPEQQAVYEHLLRESPRDSEGRYIDPVTGEVTIDQVADDNVKYKLAEQNKDLLATHTLTAEKLKATDAMGGAIYPSIAISKPEVFAGENYGDITLVGGKDFIDPKNRQNKVKVFDNDIYSPRVPKPDYKVKNIPNEYKEMMAKTNYDPNHLLNYPKDVIGDGLDSKIYRDSYMANKTGVDNIAKVPSDKYSEYLKEDVFNKQEYRDYAKKMHNMLEMEKRLLMGETSVGNAIYKPYTPENILKKMNKIELKGGERPYSSSPDSVYAAEELKNIKAIKNKQDLLQKVDIEKLNQIRDKNRKLVDKIEDALGEQGMHFYQIKEKIADYLNTGNTEGLTAKSIALLDAYKQELDSDPRLYFEAKMRRMVGLDEFKKAVIPDNLDDETRAILKNRGVETIEYKAGDNADRMAKLNALDDLKFKKTQSENLVRVAKENLQARHQELTGDQSIAFNEWANELERRAQGFFDEKTGKITINDGDLNTLNHELGHKLLTRADNRAELLADIRNTVGDEALNAKYGENYAQQVANMNPEERANLFAEEYLADGFSDYYNGILAGEDSQRLGAKLGIPPRVLATYDRIVEAIKGILGLQQDTLKQFYAQAETGKFAQNYKQNTPVYNESPVYKAAFPKVQKEDLATPELEKYGIKPTKTEYNQALEYVLMEERPELFERYEKARLGLEALEENIEFNQFTPTELERLYGKNYAEHLDRGMISQMVRKDSVNGLDQAAMRGDMSEVDMEDYVDRLNNYYETKREVKDLEQEIREAYADPELREDAKQALWFNKYEEIENAVANLRQNGVDIDFDGYVQLKYGDKAKSEAVKTEEKLDNEDVATENAKMDENIVSEAPLTKETDQKTRKFAETVLDTDTPPKDFVKLMHAGDESLKYTPKKNSELWNKATKSVQESPERVFNELENTRVVNDETMAKGIALAKHYQAMGDDLKASELYVELAKKATEAGRTVQALNLMRRTTPEGVLMSTMREVENYNDNMKNKPNKQINITPEQRAEFLGKLREAYAMPEGDLKEIRARRIAIGEAIREVRDQIPSSKWDKFTTLWKAGLLTSPTTHIRNIAGNVINGGSEKTAQTIGSAFDWMISKGTGRHIIFYAILLIWR